MATTDDDDVEFEITTVDVGEWMLPLVVLISLSLLFILPLLVTAKHDVLVAIFPSLAWDPETKRKQYDCYWDSLPEKAKTAARTLGYSKEIWDADREPPTSELDWSALTRQQQKSAEFLGYDQDAWEESSSDSSSSSASSAISSIGNTIESAESIIDTDKVMVATDNARTPSNQNNDDDSNASDLSSVAKAVLEQLQKSPDVRDLDEVNPSFEMIVSDENSLNISTTKDAAASTTTPRQQSSRDSDSPPTYSLPQSLQHPHSDTEAREGRINTLENVPEDDIRDYNTDNDSLSAVTAAMDAVFTAGMTALFAGGPRPRTKGNNKYAQTKMNIRKKKGQASSSGSTSNDDDDEDDAEGLDNGEQCVASASGNEQLPQETEATTISHCLVDTLLTVPTMCTRRNTADGEESDSEGEPSEDDLENFQDDGCCQNFFWCRPRIVRKAMRKVAKIAKYDSESKELFRMGFPFLLISIIYGAADIGEVSIVGLKLGTTELSVFVVVETLLGITDSLLGGPIESLVTVCSQAIGAKKYSRAGSYIQIATILYVLMSIPHIVLWWFMIAPGVKWFGFDEEVGQLAERYTRIALFSDLIGECSNALHMTYYLHGYVITSSVIETVEVFVWLAALLAWVYLADTDLIHIAYMEMGFAVASLIFNIVFLNMSGWFDEYLPGLFGSFALADTAAVKIVVRTAIPMTVGHVLTYGEWEILILLAGLLGPAEVTAWGLLGTIWETLEMITNSIGDAAEIRCAQWLGAGKPAAARLSAYKSLLFCMIVGIVASAGILASYKHLPTWLTSDVVLQQLIQDSIPLVALGNITLTFGSLAWTMVGSQGR